MDGVFLQAMTLRFGKKKKKNVSGRKLESQLLYKKTENLCRFCGGQSGF